jgi:hypothetical protein
MTTSFAKCRLWYEECDMSERVFDAAKNIVPFAPVKDVHPMSESMERSGEAIVRLVQQAASAAKDKCDRALDVAHQLSVQLRASHDRIKELEHDVRHYHDRAVRSERWLARIYNEIEEKFFDPKALEPERPQPVRR